MYIVPESLILHIPITYIFQNKKWTSIVHKCFQNRLHSVTTCLNYDTMSRNNYDCGLGERLTGTCALSTSRRWTILIRWTRHSYHFQCLSSLQNSSSLSVAGGFTLVQISGESWRIVCRSLMIACSMVNWCVITVCLSFSTKYFEICLVLLPSPWLLTSQMWSHAWQERSPEAARASRIVSAAKRAR